MRATFVLAGPVLAGLALAAAPAAAEPDQFVAGLGIYVGVNGGPTILHLPDLKTIDYSVNNDATHQKFAAEDPLFGFGGGLSIGLPLDITLLGGGLRLEVRGSLASLSGHETDQPTNDPNAHFIVPFPAIDSALQLDSVSNGIRAVFDREATIWWGESRAYLDYRSTDMTLSPYIGVLGGAVDQVATTDYQSGKPATFETYVRQKDDIDTRYIGGELGLDAEMLLDGRWSLGVNGSVGLLRAKGTLAHRVDRLDNGDVLYSSREVDEDTALAVKLDLGLSAGYRFAGGITLRLAVSGSYLSAVATLDTGDTFDNTRAATRLDFAGAWQGQTNLTLSIPF